MLEVMAETGNSKQQLDLEGQDTQNNRTQITWISTMSLGLNREQEYLYLPREKYDQGLEFSGFAQT